VSNDYRCYESHDSMSGSVTNESESGEVQAVTRHYVVGRIPNFDTVVEWVTESYAPRYVPARGGYWVRRRLNVKGIGNLYWDIAADYETLVPKDDGGDENSGGNVVPGSIAWDTTGRTERIYQALQETVYPNGEPGFDCAINVSGSSVEGIDVPKPGMRYSETWIFPASIAMTDAYVESVFRTTGTCNAEPFRFFKPGEGLFMGGRCQWQGDQPYATISFEWEGRPNVPDYYVSPGFGQTFPKEGWEYVWCRYSEQVDSSTLVRRPRSAHKNRLFEKASWSGLLITGVDAPGRPVTPNQPQPGVGAAVNAFFGN
jgi:hypothetical protein